MDQPETIWPPDEVIGEPGDDEPDDAGDPVATAFGHVPASGPWAVPRTEPGSEPAGDLPGGPETATTPDSTRPESAATSDLTGPQRPTSPEPIPDLTGPVTPTNPEPTPDLTGPETPTNPEPTPDLTEPGTLTAPDLTEPETTASTGLTRPDTAAEREPTPDEPDASGQSPRAASATTASAAMRTGSPWASPPSFLTPTTPAHGSADRLGCSATARHLEDRTAQSAIDPEGSLVGSTGARSGSDAGEQGVGTPAGAPDERGEGAAVPSPATSRGSDAATSSRGSDAATSPEHRSKLRAASETESTAQSAPADLEPAQSRIDPTRSSTGPARSTTESARSTTEPARTETEPARSGTEARRSWMPPAVPRREGYVPPDRPGDLVPPTRMRPHFRQVTVLAPGRANAQLSAERAGGGYGTARPGSPASPARILAGMLAEAADVAVWELAGASPAGFTAARDGIARDHDVVVVDAGTARPGDVTALAIDASDQLVITVLAVGDAPAAAADLLSTLEKSGRRAAVRNAVTLVLLPVRARGTDVSAIETHFAARTRVVIRVPADRSRVTTDGRDPWRRAATEVRAGL